MKYRFFILFFNVTSFVSAQVLVDENRNPIPYVDIISNNNSLLWQTGLDGRIPTNVLKESKFNDSITFHHISFNDLTIKSSNIKDSIFLISRTYSLEEVIIESKTPKYQKISACFRNTVIQNGLPIYYSDGKTHYLTKKKIDFKLFRYEYRTYEIKNINDYVNNYKIGVPINRAYTPIPEEKYLPYRFIKKHNLILLLKDSVTTDILTADSLKIGELKQQPDYLEYSVKNIFEIKTRKAINTEVDITDFYISMIFRGQLKDYKNILIEDFSQLVYLKTNYNINLKHDKEKEIRKVETIEEIFVENISYVNSVDEDYTKSRGMPRQSKYSYEFWNECDCDLYYIQNPRFFDSMQLK